LWVMNLIFQTWAHIKKDLLIYEIPLAQIKEKKMNIPTDAIVVTIALVVGFIYFKMKKKD